MGLLSLCMIVRDEARALPRCLASVAGLPSEIVVVDTGSTDATPEIAARHGAAVIRHPWGGDFAEARNVALARAAGEWILQLDADEELDPLSRPRLLDAIRGSGASGLRLRVRSFLSPQDLQRHEDDWIVRLFRRGPGVRYEGRVHEQVRPAIERLGGRIQDADLTILHHGYVQPAAQGADRHRRNLAHLERLLAEAPEDAYAHFQRGATLHALGERAAAAAALERALALGAADLGAGIRIRLYRRLAQLALAAANFPAAMRFAAAGLAQEPEDLLCLWVSALALAFQGCMAEALPLFRRVRAAPTLQPALIPELDALLAACDQTLQFSRKARQERREDPGGNRRYQAETTGPSCHPEP